MGKSSKSTRKEKWIADESIHVVVRDADPVKDEPDNDKILRACMEFGNGVKMRVIWGGYGPGTVQSPISRYWWMLGENGTVICRDVATANWFREQLKKFISDLDGVVLEVDS